MPEIQGSPQDLTVPARHARAVTPHNTNTIEDGACRSLYIGVGGDVALVAVGDTDPVVFKNVPDGGYVLVRTKIVRSSSTTATDIVALY